MLAFVWALSMITLYSDLIYNEHATGIQEFTFNSAAHEAVDEMLDILIHQQPNGKKSALLLLDVSRSGLIPLNYTFQCVAKQMKRRMITPKFHMAVLHGPNFPLPLVLSFLRAVRLKGDYDIRFFSAKERQKAVDWLLTAE